METEKIDLPMVLEIDKRLADLLRADALAQGQPLSVMIVEEMRGLWVEARRMRMASDAAPVMANGESLYGLVSSTGGGILKGRRI